MIDPLGNLEILLHIFLFNFRIKANILGSELRFTIGNHDWGTVVNNECNYYMYNHYVTSSAKKYFNNNFNLDELNKVRRLFPPYGVSIDKDIDISWTNRRACLLSFYEACPYLVITIDNEIICIHGGLFRQGVRSSGEPAQVNMTNDLLNIQTKIDRANSLAVISQDENFFLSDSDIDHSPLWTRYYQRVGRIEACTKTDFKMTVIGHCPTDRPNGGYHAELMEEQRYAGCDQGGCVLVGCEDGINGPGLALVDITMSRAFRVGNPSDNNRRGDILYLMNNDDGPNTRFYNNIYRINVGGSSSPEVIQVYPPSAESPDPEKPYLSAPSPPLGNNSNENLYKGGKRGKKTRRKRKMSRKYKR